MDLSFQLGHWTFLIEYCLPETTLGVGQGTFKNIPSFAFHADNFSIL
jgi:hypothetical protein